MVDEIFYMFSLWSWNPWIFNASIVKLKKIEASNLRNWFKLQNVQGKNIALYLANFKQRIMEEDAMFIVMLGCTWKFMTIKVEDTEFYNIQVTIKFEKKDEKDEFWDLRIIKS